MVNFFANDKLRNFILKLAIKFMFIVSFILGGFINILYAQPLTDTIYP